MKRSRYLFRLSLPIVLFIGAYFGWAQTEPVPENSQADSKLELIAQTLPLYGNYDIRVLGGGDLDRLIKERSNGAINGRSEAILDGRDDLEASIRSFRNGVPGLEIRFSQALGATEVVRNRSGALTAPDSGREGAQIALNFLRNHASIYELSERQIDQLVFQGESKSPSGLRMVRFSQNFDGLPVFQSDTRIILDREGRLIRTVGRLAANVDDTQVNSLVGLSPVEALNRALLTVGKQIDSRRMSFSGESPDGRRGVIQVEDDFLDGPVGSQVVLFTLARGLVIPAYSFFANTTGGADWYLLVDAADGTLLFRKNARDHASTEEAQFSVYVQANGTTPADNPSPQSPSMVTPGSGTQFPEIARTVAQMSAAQDLGASPNGWIPDGSDTSIGNNVDAYLDRDGNDAPDPGTLDNNGRPVGNTDSFGNDRDFLGSGFNYTPAPSGGNPDAGDDPSATDSFKRGAVTQLFYTTNWFHDQLFNLGFDEAAGNFQTLNFSGLGAAGDHILAEVQQGAGSSPPSFNNANFSTPPDGQSGIMRMFIFNGPNPDRDGSLDAEIVIHELAHGLTNRIIGNAAGLNWLQGSGMGEGWSDFYALALLNNTNGDDPDGQYATGAYATYKLGGLTDNYLYGIRRFPYSTDNGVNPLTWADVDDTTDAMTGGIAVSPLGFQFAGANEVHNSGEVWCLSLWEMRSRIITDNSGDVPTGNNIALQIVTDGLKLTPIDPTFVEARDALIDADCAGNNCDNETSIWGGFSDRGLGYKATSSVGVSTHSGIRESFSVPHLDVFSISLDDSAPNGNGNGFPDQGETITLNIDLLNPWRSSSKAVASATATLSSTTSEITIVDNSSAYGAIPAQGTASGDSFSFTIDAAASCGQSMNFSLQTTSSLGTFSVDFSIRLGMPNGTLAPITYTQNIPGGQPIPDGFPAGTQNTMNITDDFEIADLDFRLDSLTHTWVGDLTVMLRGPSGFGTDLVFRLAGSALSIGQNAANNFINTRFDDSSSNDLLVAPDSAAPFTGTWLPILNSPSWTTPDPVGQLGNFNGGSTLGDWTVFAADYIGQDSGSLNAWSIIVTPVAYVCVPFVPATPDLWVDLGGAGDYTDIQSAVNAANPNDTIHVVQGVYTTASGNVVDWRNKDLTLIGGYDAVNGTNNPKLFQTVIDGGGVAFRSCVYTENLTRDSLFTGFTVRRGKNGVLNSGGGIHNENSKLAITHCVIHSNTANWGAGIANLHDSDSLITHSFFFSNEAFYGAAIHNNYGSESTIVNCVFYKNSATYGGAIRNVSSNSLTVNCSFGNNFAARGESVHNRFSSPTLRNVILWNTHTVGNEISDNDGLVSTVTFSIVDGGFAGAGNLNADPLYTFLPGSELTVQFGSPAINSGTSHRVPNDDIVGHKRPQGFFWDMGAYEKLVPFISSHKPGAKLSGTSETFKWVANSAPVTAWGMTIGDSGPGSTEFFKKKLGTSTSVVVSGLPNDGRKLYVRLYYFIGTNWFFAEYTYEAFN